jgi:ATP-dependent helicase HrpB
LRSRPAPSQTLPIDRVLPALIGALRAGHAVLTAPTGSGKTTGVPLALLDQPWLAGAGILMLEPRRAAARMAAARMAELLGERPGDRVGYQVRFERCIGPRSRIQVLTEGILTRRIQSDPELAGWGLVLFDEFHERSLNADLGLALTLDVSALRPDLRILVMSATLETAAVAELLGGAPVIEGGGRRHPVEIRYADRPLSDPVAAVAPAVRGALAEGPGDLLAFLPGAAEIGRVGAELSDGLEGVDLLPLHGALPLAEQDRALRPPPSGRRRVILATDIAETSLTIDGIAGVIDSGLTRKPRFEPGRGLTRLVTEPISRASAEQRAGRAGRIGPGVCWRLWTRGQERGRPAHRPAEILQADLAPVALELALWGVADPSELRWLDPPPSGAWAQALALLRRLGAIDARGAITPNGRRMATLPLSPRLARMLIDAPAAQRALAADLAALLEERSPWVPMPGAPRPADLTPALSALAAFREGRATPGFDARRLRQIERVSGQYQRLLRGLDAPPAPATGLGPGALLACAYPDRIAQNRGPDRGRGIGRFLLADGIGAVLPRDDALAIEPYLVVADLEVASGDHRIRAALPVGEPQLRTVTGSAIRSVASLRWDAGREAVAAREERRLGALVLASRPMPIDDPDAALALLLDAIRREPEKALRWSRAARQLQARVGLARRLEPDADWPDLSDGWLLAHLQDWLAPWLQGRTRLADVRALDLAEVLTQALGWQRARRLHVLAPTALTTPAGTRRPVDYDRDGDEAPVLKAPMQELFGAAETPAVFDGRLPLLVHLLSPAGRPLQITRDLAGFWRGAYAEVRREMRGRYPKHHWPEDPAAAKPVKGGLKRTGPGLNGQSGGGRSR